MQAWCGRSPASLFLSARRRSFQRADAAYPGARAQAGGGIAISGLVPGLHQDHSAYNATYAPTGTLVEGYPVFSAGPDKHLFRHSETDEWQLRSKPFDPADDGCVAWIPAAAGPVPTGARAWTVHTGGNVWGDAEVTAREVA